VMSVGIVLVAVEPVSMKGFSRSEHPDNRVVAQIKYKIRMFPSIMLPQFAPKNHRRQQHYTIR
jgi:hypothetical protein